jgi:hypothetical protein
MHGRPLNEKCAGIGNEQFKADEKERQKFLFYVKWLFNNGDDHQKYIA